MVEEWAKANPDADEDTNPWAKVPSGQKVETAIDVLSYFEDKYKCSGICKTALFYYSLPLADKIPKDTCVSHLKDEIGKSLTALGVASVVCGVVILLIFICQYALWCKYEDQDEIKSMY